jgi:hypothetical protein
MPSVLRRETFNPTLLESESLVVSAEQQNHIREILDIGASDSRFAAKMYDAIYRVLTSGPAIPPIVSSLSPNTVVIGSPTFDIHVMGSGFVAGSVIMFNGIEEPTTVVSPTELTTGVNMPLWTAEAEVPVTVLNPDGVLSDPLTFSFTAAAAQSNFGNTPPTTDPNRGIKGQREHERHEYEQKELKKEEKILSPKEEKK